MREYGMMIKLKGQEHGKQRQIRPQREGNSGRSGCWDKNRGRAAAGECSRGRTGRDR